MTAKDARGQTDHVAGKAAARLIAGMGLVMAVIASASCGSPTPAAPTPQVYSTPLYGRVAVAEAIVRQAPDVAAEEVARLPRGAEVRVLGSQGEWLQVQAPSVTGWVLGDLVTIGESSPTLLPAPTPTHLQTASPLPPSTLTPRPTPPPAAALLVFRTQVFHPSPGGRGAAGNPPGRALFAVQGTSSSALWRSTRA